MSSSDYDRKCQENQGLNNGCPERAAESILSVLQHYLHELYCRLIFNQSIQMEKPNMSSLSLEFIRNKICVIRGKKVMMDRDLADLYGVKTHELNQAVKRNANRFPDDFMFQLSKSEFDNLISQFVISSWGGSRHLPHAFTEQGVAMLSSVLRSERAVQVNIQIMRTFTRIREILVDNKELRDKIEKLEKRYDGQFKTVFDAIRLLLTAPDKPTDEFGFKLKRPA